MNKDGKNHQPHSISKNHRVVGIGRDLWQSSSPTSLLKQVVQEQVAQGCYWTMYESLTRLPFIFNKSWDFGVAFLAFLWGVGLDLSKPSLKKIFRVFILKLQSLYRLLPSTLYDNVERIFFSQRLKSPGRGELWGRRSVFQQDCSGKIIVYFKIMCQFCISAE